MSTTIELPRLVSEWLLDKHIELDPADPASETWAEWDSSGGRLYLAWWEEERCPNCGQTDRPRVPVAAPEGMALSWQHGCGVWWEPYFTKVDIGDELHPDLGGENDEFYVHKLNIALAEVKHRQKDAIIDLTNGLAAKLIGFLGQYTTEDERQANRTGSQIEPGIWRNDDGKWEAWENDPSDESTTITVTEDDVKVCGTDPAPDVEVKYRLVQVVHLNSGKTFQREMRRSPRPFTAGQVMVGAMEPAAWDLSTTPAPNWEEVFAEVGNGQVPDDASALFGVEEEDEPEVHIPEPTGVIAMHTDDGRHVVIPGTSIEYVEVVQYGPDGEKVIAEPGWPKDDSE